MILDQGAIDSQRLPWYALRRPGFWWQLLSSCGLLLPTVMSMPRRDSFFSEVPILVFRRHRLANDIGRAGARKEVMVFVCVG